MDVEIIILPETRVAAVEHPRIASARTRDSEEVDCVEA